MRFTARAQQWFFGLVASLAIALIVEGHAQLASRLFMAMPSVVPIAFKRAILTGRSWKAALYVGAANLGNATAGYSAVNEVVGPGYVAGGAALTPDIITGSDGITALLDFIDVSFVGATFTARYLLIYDNNLVGKEGFVIDMGTDQSVSGGTFTIQWPAADLLTAILQVA